MRDTFGPTYTDADGKTVAVTTGLPGTWLVGRLKKNGSVSRVKSDRLPVVENRLEAERVLVPALAKYAADHGWAAVVDALPAEDAEVLPAEAAPAAAAVELDDYGQRVVNLHVAAEHHASAAVYCAAAAGAVALVRKKKLGWGKGFQKWKENLTLPDGSTISVRTVENYMNLAKIMAERLALLLADGANTQHVAYLQDSANEHVNNSKALSKTRNAQTTALELLAGFDPASLDDLRHAAIAEAVREVTSEQNLSQLYFDWGIAKAPYRPTGGDHGGGARRHELCQDKDAYKRDMAMMAAKDIDSAMSRAVFDLRQFVLVGKRHGHLSYTIVQDLIKSLDAHRMCIKDVMDELKKVRG